MCGGALHHSWLPEEGLQPCLRSLIALQLLHCSFYPRLRKPFLIDQKLPQRLFVDILLPLELVVVCHIGLLEELSRLLVGKVLLLGQDELDLALFLVLLLAEVQDVFDGAEFLDELVGLDGADSFDLGGVVAAAEDAHVDEFIFGQSEVRHNPISVDFSQGLLLVVEVSDHGRRSEDQAICIFRADRVDFAILAHVAALGFGLAWGLDHRNAHQSEHVHHVFSLLLGNVSGSLLLLQCLCKVANIFSLFLLLSCLLLYLSPSQQLSVLLGGSLAVEDPDGLDAIFNEQQRSIEQAQQVSGLVAVGVSEGSEEIGV